MQLSTYKQQASPVVTLLHIEKASAESASARYSPENPSFLKDQVNQGDQEDPTSETVRERR